jgi:hypothetical protein
MEIAMATVSLRAYLRFAGVGWQLDIDAKLFWQTVGVYFFLCC